ncbi:MAG: hypothetical protein BWY87_01120 [Deltaproteobacteria bacterium ADurb.Bin510]|nr:MAG: hypothetical protein BWY87_01120 [Deltaproteobacteria bacterium ADurb.Bin510]
MNASIKDLLKIDGVHGYALVDSKGAQIKLPSKHRLCASKAFFTGLRRQLLEESDRPGSVIEIYLEDMILTVFLARSTMLATVSSRRTNLAMLRMTGKLVTASLTKDR